MYGRSMVRSLALHSNTNKKKEVVRMLAVKQDMFNRTYNYMHTIQSVPEYDVVVVGGGIVGLAVAQEITGRTKSFKVGLLEKETELATHQTGHNSGVIHAGIYYKPGSVMAKLCVEGMKSTYSYCDQHNIPYKKVGKLVVATNDIEEKRLLDLWERANLNQVPDIELVDSRGIKEREPACVGSKAIWSPHTGIVDWGRVARHYGTVFQSRGGKIHTNFQADKFSEIDGGVQIVSTTGEEVRCKHVIACTGLYSDRTAKLTGCHPEPKIVPFRGEYLLLSAEKSKLINGNIYPVPDPRFPFLGVHFTPRMNGEVWLGPNAVLAFAREGYTWGTFNIKDLAEVLLYPGFYRLASKYVGYGIDQMLGSIFITRAVNELKKYVPQVEAKDISRGPAGVRAQAMNTAGDLVGEFIFSTGEGSVGSRILHCRNAPSPAATSSLAIAKMVVDKMQTEFNIQFSQK